MTVCGTAIRASGLAEKPLEIGIKSEGEKSRRSHGIGLDTFGREENGDGLTGIDLIVVATWMLDSSPSRMTGREENSVRRETGKCLGIGMSDGREGKHEHV